MRAAAAVAALALVAVAGPLDVAAQSALVGSMGPGLRGFVDFGYVFAGGDTVDGFVGGRVLGQMVYGLGDRWTVFGEVGARAAAGAGVNVALERISARFEPREELRFEIGRFHTPVAYWNTEYPSGGWARTTVAPPSFLDRESAWLPLYSVGLRAAGELRARYGDAGLAIVVSNGRSPDAPIPGEAGDLDGRRAWTAAAHIRPAAARALRIGAALHRDRSVTASEIEIRERVLSAHVAWERQTPELVAEYVGLRHHVPLTRETHVGRAFYVQLAYRLSDRYRAFKPYVRMERSNTAEDDPFYAAPIPDRRAEVFGIRYDLSAVGAVKVEYRAERVGAAPGRSGSVHVQLGLALVPPERPPLIAIAPPVRATAGGAAERAGADVARRDTADDQGAGDGGGDAAARGGAAAGSAEAEKSAPAAARRLDPVAIVVHPAAPVEDLSLPELRRIFRGDRLRWDDESSIVLLVRSPLAVEREVVSRHIFRMGEAEFRQLWLSKIFRDAMVSGPKVVSDLETARRLVAVLPGAITYLPAAEVVPGMRVLRIDGKLPGEPGYPLQ